jgi:hypothetical protein
MMRTHCGASILLIVARDAGSTILLLVGMTLVGDGQHFHSSHGYLDFAIAFSASVVGLNLLATRAGKRHLRLIASGQIVDGMA